MKIELDKMLKKELNRILREMGLLNENTESITINCNDGKVGDIKVTLRFK
jgi:hypothetical protein